MQKITPFLWYDNQVEEALELYTTAFKDSKVGSLTRNGEAGPGPAGTVMMATFQLAGREFMALNGGPHFKFSPAVSFFVDCETQEEVDALWGKLSAGGIVLMELGAYPFSEKFGWLEDKFGLSWQLNLAGRAQKITPFMMYVGEQHGKAEEAVKFYTSLFKDSSVLALERYGAGEGGTEGTVQRAVFSLAGQGFIALDGGLEHSFTFTPATSFFVNCETQEEVDVLWEKFTAEGEEEQCGWLKDRYGLSWQIIPAGLVELLYGEDAGKSKKAMEAMLQMKKIDLGKIRRAYEQG